jgi:nucleotide-binding universal stress UspA family protein
VGGHEPQLALPTPSNSRASWRRVHVEGDPEDEIVRFAEKEEVDLVFMATQGVDTLREVVAGRTTERVMRRAPCPVCVVPEG